MKRIENKFQELKQKKQKALVVYVTAGDPDIGATYQIASCLAQSDVDILEIGIPFSDPTADGPIIQEASQRALKNGVSLPSILNMIKSLREVSDIPVVLFGYYNPIFAYGNEQFAKDAKKSGVDGILIVDLPPEESNELRKYTDPASIDFISLVAPTTSLSRTKIIAKKAGGFIYFISITGVTGSAIPDDISSIAKDVDRIRTVTKLPIVVGFGISTPSQAREISKFADGIVIGSAFVKLINDNKNKPDMLEIISSYAKELKSALS